MVLTGSGLSLLEHARVMGSAAEDLIERLVREARAGFYGWPIGRWCNMDWGWGR